MPLRLANTLKLNWEVLTELSNQMCDAPGTLVPFVGAGISCAYDMPSWRQFLDQLIRYLERRQHHVDLATRDLQGLLDRGELMRVAELLVERLGEVEFRTKLQSTFRLKAPVRGGVASQVISLAERLIITTNYDRVLERLWTIQLDASGDSRGVTTARVRSRTDAIKALKAQSPTVLKLHGDIEEPESWVLTETSYRQVYDDRAFHSALNQFLSSRIPLFIGCSMTEERILTAMREAECVGYAILPLITDPIERRRLTKSLSDVVQIVWLDPADIRPGERVFDLLAPLLDWLRVRRNVGVIDWHTEVTARVHWPALLQELLDARRYRDAIEWIEANWRVQRSWNLALEYLRLCDLAAFPNGWSRFTANLSDELSEPVPPRIATSIKYYHARLMGQAGKWSHALGVHYENRPRLPASTLAQAKSWFEIGQLRFRTEDFAESERVLEELLSLAQNDQCGDAMLADITKFLAAIRVVDVVYDPPGAEHVWTTGTHRNGGEALDLAEFARECALRCDYADAEAWSWIVEAFAREAMAEWSCCDDAYSRAMEVIEAKACRTSTLFHLLLYRSGYARRRGDTATASDLLNAAEQRTAGRNPDHLRLAEQRLLVARCMSDHRSEKALMRKLAVLAYEPDQMLDGSTSVERRMRLVYGRAAAV